MRQTSYPQHPLLIVDDEEPIIDGCRETLLRGDIDNVICCTDSREALDLVSRNELEAVVLDLTMPYVSGEELLETIVATQPNVPVLVVTGNNDIESAINCMKIGAHDYLVRPVSCERLLAATRVAIGVRELRRENQSLRGSLLADGLREPEDFAEIVTVNRSVKSILMYIESVSKTPYPILISGETGVGKELFAMAIHKSSKRTGKFVAVNVAGLDDNMFSDTLFGHTKGAFTGADAPRAGLIASAAGGTLLLDEIGDLSLPSQVKLLRLLQEMEYMPVGQDRAVKTDARIIVSTNVDLAEKQRAGSFRTDLYYRLNTHKISIPPLRNRLDDLPFLVNHFLDRISGTLNKAIPTPPRELMSLLSAYEYPGNIRELEAMITDAVSRHDSHVLSMRSFREHIGDRVKIKSCQEADHASVIFPDNLPTCNELKYLLIKEAVVRAGGSYTLAAELIGSTRQAVSRHMKKDLQGDCDG